MGMKKWIALKAFMHVIIMTSNLCTRINLIFKAPFLISCFDLLQVTSPLRICAYIGSVF